jgi:hypothetical protein
VIGLLVMAAAAAAGANPAVLIVHSKDGYQFAHFTSMARCEATKALIIAERRTASADLDRQGYRVVVPAEFSAECVPG